MMVDGTNEADNVETFICDGCGESVQIDEMYEVNNHEFCSVCSGNYLVFTRVLKRAGEATGDGRED